MSTSKFLTFLFNPSTLVTKSSGLNTGRSNPSKPMCSRLGFLELPDEVRNPVYMFVIEHLPPIICFLLRRIKEYERCGASVSPGLPGFAFANRQLHLEFLSLYLRHVRARFNETRQLWQLETILYHLLYKLAGMRFQDWSFRILGRWRSQSVGQVK